MNVLKFAGAISIVGGLVVIATQGPAAAAYPLVIAGVILMNWRR